ncbi:hypothetical protein GH714_026513 [Hevea brasiliensis]|uniref:Uncharacterized protein n=1 Tax=Hevea brasiliensis TaxID=3981 RepID=A0A6A6MDF7_HEVBR|nr:hypothetical protein GH714_026513 [Hevea brasiliensis]
MVNLSCQVQGLLSLIKDFCKELQLFRTVTENCLKLANFVNNKSQVRSSFQKYRMQELDYAGLLRLPSSKCECTKDFTPVYVMLEDIWSCARVLQMVVLDDSYKIITVEDSVAEEIAGMIQNEGFWNDLEAVYSLMKLIRGMAYEIEVERPLIGQCLPLWEDLKAKVKDWSARFNIVDGHVEKMEEAHVALMELMKWRSEGLDPLYAQAVQVKQRDPLTGKMKIAHPQGSRLVWETCLSEYKTLGKVAVRLIFLHATSCGFKCNRSSMNWVCMHRNSSVGLERAQKMIFIAAHAKLERRDFLNEEEKDGELLRVAGCEDDVLEVFSDTPSV